LICEKAQKLFKKIQFVLLLSILSGCAKAPPRDLDNICSMFRERPTWYHEAQKVAKIWRVPIPVQMAIMHQESKFESHARPPREKLFWIIPWTRPSTAYGYAQALDQTWAGYQRERGGFFASRHDFGDGVDFIGWYASKAWFKAHISPTNTYELYLAYHEGVGGYMRRTYLQKAWLIAVAHKVSARANRYQYQLQRCERWL